MDTTKPGTKILVTKPPKNESAKKLPQYLAALVATIGAFIFGMSLGWTSTTKPPLVNNEYGFPISDSQFDTISSMMPVGAFCVTPFVGWLVTSLGRKTSMLMLCLPAVVGYMLMAWAEDVYMFYGGRFLTGVASGGYAVVVPMYTGEYAETHIRGTLGTYFQLQLTSGTLFTYVVGSVVDVFWLTLLCSLVPVIYFVLLIYIPESPVYYLEKNKTKEARKSLQWFRGTEYIIESEFCIMQQNNEDVLSQKLTLLEAFATKAARKGLAISVGLMFFQQFAGINGIIFYTDSIFKDAGSNFDSNIQTIITGVIQVLFAYVSTLVVDSLGRRPLLLFSDCAMAICTFLLGLFFMLKAQGYNLDSYSWLPVVLVCAFLIGFSLGFGPIPWVYLSEVFPRQVSGYASSIACMSNFLCLFLITNFFDDVNTFLGGESSFFIFAVLSVIGTVFVFFVVPETKNRTLEDVLKELNK